MNREVKICYSIRNNIGDAINPFIVERVVGYKPLYADQYHCEISGIGSGLGRFFYSPSSRSWPRNVRKELLRNIYRDPVVLWSAGFISTPIGDEKPTRYSTRVASVRGKLSLAAVERALGESFYDCAIGDAGILASELISNKEKKYEIGIIPHDSEKNEMKYQQIADNTPNSTIIDVGENVLNCLLKISQCEFIVSSSLHGLIIADGFGIPNKRIVLTNKLDGDGFKFLDYYSGYDIIPSSIDANAIDHIKPADIYESYKIKQKIVEKKKSELLIAFSKYLT